MTEIIAKIQKNEVNASITKPQIIVRLSGNLLLIDGKQVELAVDGNMLQWKYKYQEDWTDLYDLSTLKGDDGASIISAEFVGDDIVFTKDDETEVVLENAKTILKGEAGPNEISETTSTLLDGILAGDGSNVYVVDEHFDLFTGEKLTVRRYKAERFTTNYKHRNGIVLYEDLLDVGSLQSEIFIFLQPSANFLIKLPVPYFFIVDKSNIKIYKNGNDITNLIYEKERYFESGRNQDPLSVDHVFLVGVKEPFDSSAEYIVEWTERHIICEKPNAIPFDKELDSPNFYSIESDNMLLPKLNGNMVYEIWRWERKLGGQMAVEEKHQYKLGIMANKQEGKGRYSLICRGDLGEYDLKSITSRMDLGMGILGKQGGSGEKYRLKPFKIRIYNTDTGARSDFSDKYGYRFNGEKVGFRKLD